MVSGQGRIEFMTENFEPTQTWLTTVDSSGRVLLPSELRREFGAVPGSQMVWRKNGDDLVLASYNEVVDAVQAYFCSIDPGVCWTDELKQMRKRDVDLENRRT